MARMLVLTLAGAGSVLLGLVTGILMLFVAISSTPTRNAVHALPLAAAALQICSSCALIILIWMQTHRQETFHKRKGLVIMTVVALLLSVVSAAIDGVGLGWAESSLASNLSVFGCQVSTFLTITFVIWGATILMQLMYYFTLAWVSRSVTNASPQRLSIDNNNVVIQEVNKEGQPATANCAQPDLFQRRAPSSTPSLIHSDGTCSIRSSFSTIQRPPSSKRALLSRQFSSKQQPGASTSDGLSRRSSADESFDSWDTSGVSSHIREAVLLANLPTKGTGLEPIPGSRSPSPAKALEGPFFQLSPSITPPTSPLPQPSVSQPNSTPATPVDCPHEIPHFSAMFPPPSPPPSSQPPAKPRQYNFSRPTSRSGPASRSGSVALPRSRQGSRSRAPGEDHIHPLFRTGSPTPPPSASANTTVTAAPEGGQFINENMLKRMRSGSLPSNPSPLVRSESSPDVRAVKVPPPSLDRLPFPHVIVSRSDWSHQRKRSASFQSSINT